MTSLLFNFVFSLKTRIPEELAESSSILYKCDIKVNHTQKGTEMFMMLIRKTWPSALGRATVPTRVTLSASSNGE